MTRGRGHPGYHSLQSMVSHQGGEPGQLCEERFFIAILDRLVDAGRQVIFYEEYFELLDGFANCIRLVQNIKAGGVLFYHSTNTAQVSFNIMYSFE